MSVNPITGVDYENNRFAVWRPSLNDYIHFNDVWPRPDGGPRTGSLLFDYLYYKRVETERPVVDHRFTISTTWERVDADPLPPEGHPHGEYRQSHAVIKRPVEELKSQVESQFQVELQTLFPTSSDPAVLIEAANALALKQQNAPLTVEQQGQIDLILSVGDKVTQLRAKQTYFNAAIDANEPYDLFEPWIAE